MQDVRARMLVVMRHGKAEAFAASDHARSLTERGRAAARDAGEHLAALGLTPDLGLVSSATRTIETFTETAAGAGWSLTPEVDRALYSGSTDIVLERLRALPEAIGTVLYIGHNPTAAYLCHLLDDGQGDPEATNGLFQGFATGALAVFGIDVPWSEIDEETARLVDFYVPRG